MAKKAVGKTIKVTWCAARLAFRSRKKATVRALAFTVYMKPLNAKIPRFARNACQSHSYDSH